MVAEEVPALKANASAFQRAKGEGKGKGKGKGKANEHRNGKGTGAFSKCWREATSFDKNGVGRNDTARVLHDCKRRAEAHVLQRRKGKGRGRGY